MATETHEGHEIVYLEDPVVHVQSATITEDGNVKVGGEIDTVEFLGNTQTHVFCRTCEEILHEDNSPLSPEWEVI